MDVGWSHEPLISGRDAESASLRLLIRHVSELEQKVAALRRGNGRSVDTEVRTRPLIALRIPLQVAATTSGQGTLKHWLGSQLFNFLSMHAILSGVSRALKLAIHHGLRGPVARAIRLSRGELSGAWGAIAKGELRIRARLVQPACAIACNSRWRANVRWLSALLWLTLASACAQHAYPPARPLAFEYWRSLDVPGKSQATLPTACAVLDADIFAHTGATLSDIRLFTGLTQQEWPFAITLSRTGEVGDTATVLNLRLKTSKSLSFDLQMPPRAYSAIDLELGAQNFVGSAKVTGLTSAKDPHPTFLGVFTLFDLTAQHLGRSFSLPLAESTFPLLHIDLELLPVAVGNTSFAPATAMLTGVQVPPSRVAQTLYNPVAATARFTERQRQTVVVFQVPARVPIERVTFELAPVERRNFSRTVTITARSISGKAEATQPEQVIGSISRVHLTESGKRVEQQSLSLPAILGANAQSAATIEVAIEDEDDEPIKFAGVRLEMRERRICFSAPSAAQPEHLQMFYGGADIAPPVYDFGRIFNPAIPSRVAVLGREHTNKNYHPAPRKLTLSARYPELLWLALIGSISILGTVAFRSARRM